MKCKPPRYCRTKKSARCPCCCLWSVLHGEGSDYSSGKGRLPESGVLRNYEDLRVIMDQITYALEAVAYVPRSHDALVAFMDTFEVDTCNRIFRLKHFPMIQGFCKTGMDLMDRWCAASLDDGPDKTSRYSFGEEERGFYAVWLDPRSHDVCGLYLKKRYIPNSLRNRIFSVYVTLWRECSMMRHDVPPWKFVTKYLCNDPTVARSSMDTVRRRHMKALDEFIRAAWLFVAEEAFTEGGDGLLCGLVHANQYSMGLGVLTCCLPREGLISLRDSCASVSAVTGVSIVSGCHDFPKLAFSYGTLVLGAASVGGTVLERKCCLVSTLAETLLATVGGVIEEVSFRLLNKCTRQMGLKRDLSMEKRADISVRFSVKGAHQGFETNESGDFTSDYLSNLKDGTVNLTGYAAVVIFPLTDNGVWVRLLLSLGEYDIIQKDDTHVTVSASVVLENCRSLLGGNGGETVDGNIGAWFFIPFGSCLVCPARVMRCDHIRTSNDGNPRGVLYVSVCLPPNFGHCGQSLQAGKRRNLDEQTVTRRPSDASVLAFQNALLL